MTRSPHLVAVLFAAAGSVHRVARIRQAVHGHSTTSQLFCVALVMYGLTGMSLLVSGWSSSLEVLVPVYHMCGALYICGRPGL
jgi:hypothetical protein